MHFRHLVAILVVFLIPYSASGGESLDSSHPLLNFTPDPSISTQLTTEQFLSNLGLRLPNNERDLFSILHHLDLPDHISNDLYNHFVYGMYSEKYLEFVIILEQMILKKYNK